MAAKDRAMTIFSTNMLYGQAGVDALMRGDCPVCKKTPGPFRNALSKKEFEISGMCQEDQDKVFGVSDE